MNSSDLISIIAIIVASFSLGAQIYIGKKDVGTNLYQHVTNLFTNMNTPFLQYPELREFFYDNKAPLNLDKESYYRVIVIAEMFLDTFEWVEHDIRRATSVDKKSWREYMIGVYSSSVIIREFHENNPSWHPLFNKLLCNYKISGSQNVK